MKNLTTPTKQSHTFSKKSKFTPRPILLFGGEGEEHSVSVESAEALFRELSAVGILPLSVYIAKSGGWFIGESAASPKRLSSRYAKRREVYPIRRYGKGGLLAGSRFIRVNAAIPVLHGNLGEDGVIAGALRAAGIRFVGCGVRAGAICADKALTKHVASSLGIPTVESVTVWREQDAKQRASLIIERLYGQNSHLATSQGSYGDGVALFVKPTDLGSSVGARAVRSRAELEDALDAAFLYSDCVLVERFIEGARELECAYFEYKGKQYFTRIGEIHHSGEFYGYDEKYSSSDTEIAVAELPDSISERVTDYSRALVEALGIRQISRIDFFLDSCGKLYFNEINTMPGLTSASMLPFLIGDEGFCVGEIFADLICRL